MAELQGCISVHDSERRGYVFDLRRQGLRAVKQSTSVLNFESSAL